jgi:signal transduction histidine kinase
VQRDGDVMQLVVKDDGRGITPDFLPYVFERFRQQDASTTRSAFGLGLGLSIARHLVELHGGVITAHSSGTQQGSTFIVRIPMSSRTLPAAGRSAADVEQSRMSESA